jgi:hypothetical protein
MYEHNASLTMRNKERKAVVQTDVHKIFKGFLCDFEYLIGFDVYLLLV